MLIYINLYFLVRREKPRLKEKELKNYFVWRTTKEVLIRRGTKMAKSIWEHFILREYEVSLVLCL